MFGFLRLCLAFMVLLNHSPYNTFTFDIAVSAVIIFYLISGYTMGIKFNKYKERSSKPVFIFFLDRILRVFPLYIFFLVLTVFAILTFGPMSNATNELSRGTLLMNFLLIPVNYYMYTLRPALIPAAFSLALEEQFYLLMPILLSFSFLARPAIYISGLVVVYSVFEILSGYNLQIYNDFLIYRFLPGVLIIFMLGVSLDEKNKLLAGISKKIYFFYMLFFLVGSVSSLMRGGLIFATTLGVLVGVPLVLLLKDKKRNKFDESLGSLSYGIFLSHSLVYFILTKSLNVYKLDVWLYNVLAVVVTVLFSYFGLKFIEAPAHRIRANIIKWLLDKYPLSVLKR